MLVYTWFSYVLLRLKGYLNPGQAAPSTLDPAKSTALAESNVELALFEGSTGSDEHKQPQPAAAKSWDISPDGTEYTFHLRDNLLWNDGTPLTAHDFEYAWKRVLDPQTASENTYMMYPLNNGEAFFKQEVSADQVRCCLSRVCVTF